MKKKNLPRAILKTRINPLEEIYKESMEGRPIASRKKSGDCQQVDGREWAGRLIFKISSRIRLARNVRNYPFSLASDEQRGKVFMLAEKVMENQGDANMRLQLLSISSLPQIFRQYW